jgi:hypothetical protein
MTIRYTLTAIATGTALLFSPVLAGGPVIEDTAESAPIVRSQRDHTALLIIGAIIVGGLLIGSGGSDVCNGPDEQPTPEPGPVC